jgi:membrane protease YdiL (CAAX protease family)
MSSPVPPTDSATMQSAPRAVRQYSPAAVLGIWAAATVPMAVLAWVVAPALVGSTATNRQAAVSLLAALTTGLVWQFILVVALVTYEQRSLRWQVIRDALWLNPPTDATGRRGGRLWLWLLPFAAGFGLIEFLPIDLPPVAGHDLGAFLDSAEGQAAFRGNWGLFALCVTCFLFNTMLGEELLFRGLLLPRMRSAFGRADWIANGVLFGLYHLHQPWSIPSGVVTGVLAAYGTQRFRSAWIGIIAHSAQSIFFTVLLLGLVAA